MRDPSLLAEPITPGIRPVRLVLAVLTVLLLISFVSQWHAGQVSLPRYCQQPELALQRLAEIITKIRPAGEGDRRDYIVAAKLEFLVPQAANEPLDAYLMRLRRQLEVQCR